MQKRLTESLHGACCRYWERAAWWFVFLLVGISESLWFVVAWYLLQSRACSSAVLA